MLSLQPEWIKSTQQSNVPTLKGSVLINQTNLEVDFNGRIRVKKKLKIEWVSREIRELF